MEIVWIIAAICAFAIGERLYQYVQGRLQAVRDRAAHDLLDSFDCEKEHEMILAVARRLAPRGYVCPVCGHIRIVLRGRRGSIRRCSFCRYVEDI
jgi:hypothetical protein